MLLFTSAPQINPCNSPLHPAVQAGIQPEGAEELSVQSAYTPKSQCFGCGEDGRAGLRAVVQPHGLLHCLMRQLQRLQETSAASSGIKCTRLLAKAVLAHRLLLFVLCAGPSHPDGLHLASKRIENGLEAHISLPPKYCAFPGISTALSAI